MKKRYYITLVGLFFLLISIFNLSAQHTILKTGDKAPEIRYPNPQGDTISLFSLKGHLVIIDFWASWCGPCRISNPHIVQLYHRYKDAKFKNAKKGLKILSVSLDTQKAAWKNAINKDGLIWVYHMSDLKGWKSGASVTYGVNKIPTIFFVDQKGIIIGKDLDYTILDIELSKRLKKK